MWVEHSLSLPKPGLVSTGGGDTSIMVWSNQGRPGHSNMEEGEDTDSDSEEEGEQYIAMQLVEENVLCCRETFRGHVGTHPHFSEHSNFCDVATTFVYDQSIQWNTNHYNKSAHVEWIEHN